MSVTSGRNGVELGLRSGSTHKAGTQTRGDPDRCALSLKAEQLKRNVVW